MRRYRMWVVTLGILTLAPGTSQAEKPKLLELDKVKSLLKRDRANDADLGEAVTAKSNNQVIAEKIATALRAGKLTGYEIAIEFKHGVATLTGQVGSAKQRTRAAEMASKVRGVIEVNNQLTLIEPSVVWKPKSANPASALSRLFQKPPVRQANFQTTDADNAKRVMPVDYAYHGTSNQHKAEEIAHALSRANLNGYDITLRYQNGTATLQGNVSTPEQHALATKVVFEVPGVERVDNQLALAAFPAPPAGGSKRWPVPQMPLPKFPMIPVGYQAEQPAIPQGPAAPPNGPMPAQPNIPAQPNMQAQPNIPAPPNYGHPGSGASHVVYNMPHMPDYAWPAYASYPNYAQVTYPKEYSASAWPYIGPFYPYPQIPLGWRQAQLEWDDGYWSLNFRPRTERWFWFLNPTNW